MNTETIEVADEVVDRAEIKDGAVLVEYNRTAAALADLAARYKGAQFDLTTTAGDKAARAARQELKTLRTSLEAKRKEFKAPALEFGRRIDAEAQRLAGEIQALEDPIDAQIKADELRREQERAAKAEAERQREAEAAAAVAAQAQPVAAPAPAVAQQAAAVPDDEPATLNLKIICERLGFTVNAAFLADTLHIQPAATDRAAKLYRESQWPLICQQLQAHIGAMAELYGREVV